MNTFLKSWHKHIITYNFGENRSQTDWLLVKREVLKERTYCKVMSKEIVVTYYNVLIVDMEWELKKSVFSFIHVSLAQTKQYLK